MPTVTDPHRSYSQPQLVRYGSTVELTASGSLGQDEKGGQTQAQKRAVSVLR